jgi:hypothetical protein
MSLLLALTSGGPPPTQTLSVPAIGSTAAVYLPAVVQVVAAPSVASTAQTFGPTVVQNAVNSAFRIDGEQDALQLATRPNVSNITFAGWARIAVDRNTYSSVFSIETGPGHSTEWNEVITDTDGTTLKVFDHITGDCGTVGVMTVGVWYRVAISITSSGTYSAYFGPEGSSALTKTTGSLTNISANDYTGLGGTQFTSTEWFNGRLAGARVWNAVLSDAEIEREFKSYTPVRTANILGAWIPRDVTTGTVLTAITGANLIDGNGGGTPDYTVEAGPLLVQQLDVGQLASGSVAYVPTVATAGQSLVVPQIASTAALYAASVTNVNTLTVPQIASTVTQYNPALSLNLLAPFLASGSTQYSPSVANVNTLTVGLLGPNTVLYSGVVTNVNTLTVPQIASTANLFAPSVSATLTVPQIASGSVQYNPTLSNVSSLTVPQIASTATLYGPSLAGNLGVPQIASGSVTYSPSVTNLSTLIAPLLASTAQTYSPNVQRNLTVPAISSGSATYAPSVTRFNNLAVPVLGPNTVLYPGAAGLSDQLAVPRIDSAEQTFAPRVVSVVSPVSIVSGEALYNPVASALNTVQPPQIANGTALYGPNVSSVLTAPQIGSSEALYDPRLGFIIYVPRISTAIPYPPTVTNVNTVAAPSIPSTSNQFAPKVNLGVSAPVIVSGAIYAPTVTPGVSPAVYGQDNVLPLIRTLELPLPSTVTQIVGIHQSDIVIRSAIEAALADLRANHWLLDYVFASLPQDTLTWKEYGEKDLQEAKKWFMTTNVPVSVLPRMNESKWPQITIELMESSEVVPESTMGDVNYDPNEYNDRTWPALTPQFTPVSYVPSTGVIKLAGECEAWLGPGMYLVDRQGQAHEIIEVIDQSQFKIDPSTVADFRGCVIKGHRPAWNVSVESSSFKETYRIGVHVQNEPAHLTWLHAIVQFALLRYKQVLMEGRGFERSTISSPQIGVDQRFEAENIFTRFITISGYVRQFWPKTVAPVIDGVELDQLQVSGQNADVSVAKAGVDPLTQLWVGNLDTLRRR